MSYDRFNFNEKTLRAIISLQNNPDFLTFLQDGLAAELDKSMGQVLYTPDNGFSHSERGVAKCLTMLLTSVEKAREDVTQYDHEPT